MGRMRAGRYAAHWGLWWVVLMALWLLLTGTFDAQEVAAGVVASALAATAVIVVQAQGVMHLRPRASWLVRAGRLPARIIADNWTVLSLVLRRLVTREEIRGAFRALPFDPGGDDARSATRRALITIAITVSPNTYVVGIDRYAGLILCHQLAPSDPESADEDILGWL
jgi:multisubunit Na+/H+ antiporter MnhE subunit